MKEELAKIHEHSKSKENEDLEQAKQLMASIQEKMETAAANRDSKVEAVVCRVKEHEATLAKAHAAREEQLNVLKDKINAQLEKADEKREAELKKIQEAAREEEKKVEAARLKKEEQKKEGGDEKLDAE